MAWNWWSWKKNSSEKKQIKSDKSISQKLVISKTICISIFLKLENFIGLIIFSLKNQLRYCSWGMFWRVLLISLRVYFFKQADSRGYPHWSDTHVCCCVPGIHHPDRHSGITLSKAESLKDTVSKHISCCVRLHRVRMEMRWLRRRCTEEVKSCFHQTVTLIQHTIITYRTITWNNIITHFW